MPEAAAEYGMVRTYLDWLIELPWALPEEKPIDIAEARRILDEDHYGLDKIKRRIIEYLAVRKLAPQGKAPILCFVGPPGVGKTSLGQSIARAMDRKFVRVSLGGVHDEAEIRGHRRTYIGALPGNIIQAIRKAGTRNCVMMLDEIDKLGAGIHGDPGAALLEVLDPGAEQHVPRQLSRRAVRSVAAWCSSPPRTCSTPSRGRCATAWRSSASPATPRTRSSQIARRYLVRAPAGGERPQAGAGRDHRRRRSATIIQHYTREAGVRNLEREIGKALRHAAVRIAEGQSGPIRDRRATISPPFSGAPQFESEVAMRTSVPGVATGLAWTPVGGDILFIEATRMPGNGQADPDRPARRRDEGERAGGAVASSRTAPPRSASTPRRFEKSDIHVHVPAGAIPKDGPSAGVAMFMALVSLMTERTVRSDTAMTGEISLRGLVLPVGGIKEKVVAAARAGLKRVMLPARNRKDYEDIPEEARNELRVHLARARRGRGRRRARAGAAGRERAGRGAATRRRRGVTRCLPVRAGRALAYDGRASPRRALTYPRWAPSPREWAARQRAQARRRS